MEMKIAVIGAGVSGLTVANLLKNKYEVKVFERESVPGGLVRCEQTEGGLFHICGGHVFNTKKQEVLDWFWTRFEREKDFLKADRNSVVFMKDGLKVPYPIENHTYLFDEAVQKSVIQDWLDIFRDKKNEAGNFADFLRQRFGNTLYELYFRPYNNKVWRRDLSEIPLSWLEGKLPMPTVEEMIYNNMNHIEERSFVHSSFWYEKEGGSQFLADRLAEGVDVVYGTVIDKVARRGEQWEVAGEMFDRVVFCGNVKQLPELIEGVDVSQYNNAIEKLEYHGTTTAFCYIDNNPYSWIYLPSDAHESHRIICTGNFSPRNNATKRLTASIEFTDHRTESEIKDNLARIPLHPEYITHHYNQYTYPIQDGGTRLMISDLKTSLASHGFLMTGRFADWEYYNMDAAMYAAMQMVGKFF